MEILFIVVHRYHVPVSMYKIMGQNMTCFKEAYLPYDFRNEPYMISRQVASGTLKLQVIVLVILVHLKYME
jgi:hypothetical protein